MKKGIPITVLVLACGLAAVILVNLATGAQPDYAHLVPAPDTIVWRVGDEPALWLSSNRRAVELRADSIKVGIGEIELRDTSSGESSVLGAGLGCLDAVVSGVQVDDIDADSALLNVTLDRRATVTAVEVLWRWTTDGDSVTSSTPNVTSTTATIPLDSLAAGSYRVDVSLDPHFPAANTRTVTFTTGDAESGTSDNRSQELHMPEGTGVRLVACGEHEDVAVTLHDGDGRELARYLVDVLAAIPTPVAAAANNPPVFRPAHLARYVCVGDDMDAADYFDGGERLDSSVAATDPDGHTLSYSLAPDGDRLDYALFAISRSGAITVSRLGADDNSGLTADRLYSFVVVADDLNGGKAEAGVVVQVDMTVSTAGDGTC